MMYAEKGKPSMSNGKKIHVSTTRKLEDFFLLGDSRLHIAQEMGALGRIVEIESISQHTRFLGTAEPNVRVVPDTDAARTTVFVPS
jgi:fructose-1,6-bisphosphatase/inositol monophosphatase family enzyme